MMNQKQYLLYLKKQIDYYKLQINWITNKIKDIENQQNSYKKKNLKPLQPYHLP